MTADEYQNFPPSEINNTESLGRRINSSKNEKRAQKGMCPAAVLIRKGINNISVDRMDFAHHKVMVRIAQNTIRATSGGNFYGWLVIQAGVATSLKCKVMAAPLLTSEGHVGVDNPYHAEIHLPNNCVDDDMRYQIAEKLLQHTIYRGR